MQQHSPQQIFFCSAASRYSKEMLAGTAANYKSFILLEYNHPFPGRISDAHVDKGFLVQLETLARRQQGKLLLIRNKNTVQHSCRLVYVDCVRSRYCSVIADTAKIHLGDLEKMIQSEAAEWQYDPFFVVCTNGKKDKCCSKFGYPVFKFFESYPRALSVWESTHVGGDRFAANVVYMPFGIYYGRVQVEDVDAILSESVLGNIHPPNYRGASKRSFFNQAVEWYLRQHLDYYAIDFDIGISVLARQGDLITVQVQTPFGTAYQMVLQKEIIDYPHLLTCTSHKNEKVTKYKLSAIVSCPQT